MNPAKISIPDCTLDTPVKKSSGKISFCLLPCLHNNERLQVKLATRFKIFSHPGSGENDSFSLGITLPDETKKFFRDLETHLNFLAIKKQKEVKEIGPNFARFQKGDFLLLKIDKSEQGKIYVKIYPSKLPNQDFSCRFWQLCEVKGGIKKKKPIPKPTKLKLLLKIFLRERNSSRFWKKFHDFIFHPLRLRGKKSSPNFHFSFSIRFFKMNLFFKKQNTFFSPNKMRFSVEVQDEPKMFFHVIPAAEKATGLSRQTIRSVLKRGNHSYHRKSDNKLFFIIPEDPILIAKIEGEDFFSLEEIQEKLGLTPTIFLNQIKSGQFAKKIDWISDELFPEKAKQEKEPDELEVLREEMKFQFEKFQTEMAKFQEEIDRLSAKVEKLEKEKASLPVATAEVSPKPEAQEENQQSPIFQSKTALERTTFTEKNMARFIKDGIVDIKEGFWHISICPTFNRKFKFKKNIFHLQLLLAEG